METLLAAGVETVQTFADILDQPLFAQESAAITNVVDKRRREFTTVRACARAALARLGLPPAPIVPGPRGAPVWPAGVVGSLTHCDGYSAAAVARSYDITAIGIDAEPHAALPEGVLAAIALPQERERLARLAGSAPRVCWDRLLFSAKESVYKAWFPMTGRWLDFEEADVTFGPDLTSKPDVTFQPRGGFTAQLLTTGPVVGGHELTRFTGRWRAVHGLIITAVIEPAR